MAHKTITISEEAYERLKALKQTSESFTDVILRITRTKRSKEDLLAWLKKHDRKDLAASVEESYQAREKIDLRYDSL